MTSSSTLSDRVHAAATADTAQAGADGTVAVQTAPRDPVRAMLDSMASEFEAALPGFIPVESFLRVALTGLKTTRGLAACSHPSLLAALLDCAQTGLMPCTNEAAIIPYGDTATFVPQYQGYIEIFHRTGKVERVELDWVRKCDRLVHVKGDEPCFQHFPDHEKVDDYDPYLAYAFLRYSNGGRSDISFLTRKQAERIRDKHSKGYQKAEGNGKRDSPWHTSFDEMWLKSTVRRLAKYVPKSPELAILLSKDTDSDGDLLSASPVITLPGEVIREDPAEASEQR
jgi:recombination protein RecT